ncbi:MAG: carbohydrate-binding domain-containing protein, partial [Clostridia bacterium]|nr:carbohydrate-binding domain-containing protein [Clostridia bacterium]
MKKLIALFAVITAISILFASCGTANNPTGSGTETEAVSVPAETVEDPTNDELIATGEFTVSPSSGVTVDGNVYTVTAAGEYTFKGALDGSIVVDAGDEDEVILIFEGVTLTSSDTAPVCVKNAGEVSVKSEEGSYNTVNDNRTSTDASASDGDIDGNAA